MGRSYRSGVLIVAALSLLASTTSIAQFGKYLEKPKFAAIPIVTYNRSYGGIFGGFGGLFFPVNKLDTASPASSASVGGIISTNKTWFGFGVARLYYSKDNHRTTVGAGLGDQNFQYFNENYGSSGAFIAYSTLVNFAQAEQLIRVVGRLYVGGSYTYYKVKTDFGNLATEDTAKVYAAFGIPLAYDTRDNVNNPSRGWFSNLKFKRFDEAFGSATEYTKMDLDASRYFHKVAGHVYAFKVSLSTALGSVPFEAQTIVGGNVIRGYTEGKYRGDQVYAFQGEYRWKFHEKWGAVFFAGGAVPVSPGVTSELLPSAGAGIRFMMIPEIGINAGLDAAVGKGDYGIYFRIGEAF